MALTADQLSDMRADLGDQTSPYAFTDAELERNFERRGEVYDDALVLCIDQLMIDAAKLYNYTAGYTKIERDKIFEKLAKMRDVFSTRDGNDAFIVGTAVVPPKWKSEPSA